MLRRWAVADGLSGWLVAGLCLLLLLWLGQLLREVWGRPRAFWLLGTGLLAMVGFSLSVLRPAWVMSRGSVVGPRVVVLLDVSRRLLLPAEGETRADLAHKTLRELLRRFSEARVSVLGFAEGEPSPLPTEPKGDRGFVQLESSDSDLEAALAYLAQSPGERPRAVVVVSDGRFSRPTESLTTPLGDRFGELRGVPVHTVSLTRKAPADIAIRTVKAAGAAVAHQSLTLRIEVGCGGGLVCERVPVTVRELLSASAPSTLAHGTAVFKGDSATLELSVVLERTGHRVIEVALEAPPGDTIPQNNTRYLTLSVTRERVRLLHVAGRPTYDVRALRVWLKSNESVDLVAFFILRTPESNTQTLDESELALIPFPVDELFTEHLPSFDAIVLQDIDAIEHRFTRYFPALAQYVRAGGGLILVGGPRAFAGGGYADTPLEAVLPVELSSREPVYDPSEFVARYTQAGREAPSLRALRDLFGEELPPMVGVNVLGNPRSGTVVLWEHPVRRLGVTGMPVLALGEAGDGRAIALGVDSTHQLSFSEFAEGVAGRGYGALWDGLLGWLMRDTRFEPVRIELSRECVAGVPAVLKVTWLPGTQAELSLTLERLGEKSAPRITRRVPASASGSMDVDVGPLDPGGYTVRARLGEAPPTRFDFACEQGGSAWSDSRPDPERLESISKASGGRAVSFDGVTDLPVPEATEILAERKTVPILPPWAWTLGAASLCGLHWLLRRREGLA